MDVVLKNAVGTVSPGSDDGSFEIVLSTGTKDRDGEEVNSTEWEQPLPDHITMDADHGMTAEKTVGSGKPSIEDGRLIVRGTWAKTPLAQDIRSLVNDGHITKTSVAFLRKTSVDQKSGSKVTTRELLNGAFVAIPANPEAVILSSKAGARNNQSDVKSIQAIHDHTAALGASCAGSDEKAVKAVTNASWDGSAARFTIEQWKASTLIGPLGDPQSKSSYKLPVLEPNGDVNSNAVHAAAAALAGGRGGVDAPGPEKAKAAKRLVALYHQLKADPPDSLTKLAGAKAFLPEVARKSEDPSALIAAVDASLDEACNQLGKVDLDSLPFPVQQALALVTSASATVDHLMDLCGITDPDRQDEKPAPKTDEADSSSDTQDDNSKPAASAADKAATSAARASDDESALKAQLSHIQIMASIYGTSE
jgi:hypothetical protein